MIYFSNTFSWMYLDMIILVIRKTIFYLVYLYFFIVKDSS